MSTESKLITDRDFIELLSDVSEWLIDVIDEKNNPRRQVLVLRIQEGVAKMDVCFTQSHVFNEDLTDVELHKSFIESLKRNKSNPLNATKELISHHLTDMFERISERHVAYRDSSFIETRSTFLANLIHWQYYMSEVGMLIKELIEMHEEILSDLEKRLK